MTIHWKAVQQFFTVVLFGFQFYLVCNFGKFIDFLLGLSGVKGLMKPRQGVIVHRDLLVKEMELISLR